MNLASLDEPMDMEFVPSLSKDNFCRSSVNKSVIMHEQSASAYFFGAFKTKSTPKKKRAIKINFL